MRVGERPHGPRRRRPHRQGRQTLAFANAYRDHRGMSGLSVGLDHFCRPHRRGRLTQEKQGSPRRPAMAAGLTDHMWPIREG